jgi:hypothetical protein
MGRLDVIGGLGAVLFGGLVYFLVRDSKDETVESPGLHASVVAATALREARMGEEELREARKEAEAGKMFYGPMFQLHRDDGRVNGRLLELAGIPLSKQDEMDDLLDKFSERLSKELDARREPIPEESDPANRKLAFRVPADPEAARAAKTDFEEEVRRKFGAAAARIFTPYATKDRYAGWGEYDLTIRFSMGEGYGGEKRVVNYAATDPASGKRMASGGTSDPDGYRRMFGTAFSDVKFETP